MHYYFSQRFSTTTLYPPSINYSMKCPLSNYSSTPMSFYRISLISSLISLLKSTSSLQSSILSRSGGKYQNWEITYLHHSIGFATSWNDSKNSNHSSIIHSNSFNPTRTCFNLWRKNSFNFIPCKNNYSNS
jgi:hypothetical protein